VPYNAGSIESRLDVDTRPFAAGLDEAKTEAREFADKRYTATVDINTRRSQDELSAVEQRLRGIESTVDRISTKSGGRSGGGSGGFLGALSRAGGHAPSARALGIGAALPLAGPLGGVLAGGAASLLTPAVAGGLGLGIFGAAAKSSITTVGNDVQKLTKLTQQYNAAATDKQRATVLAKEQQLWAGLDPAQRQAVKNVQGLDASWAGFQKKLQPQTFGALAGGAKLANTGLNYLLPTAKAVGDEIETLERRAEKAFEQPFWHQFFGQFLPGEAARSVGTFGSALGQLLTGGAHLMEDFAPLGHDLEGVVVRLTTKFDQWTQGAGPVKFVAWVEREGPLAAKALEGLAHGLEGLGKGLFPLGQVELQALTPVLDLIGDLGRQDPALLTAVGAAYVTVSVGLKALSAIRGAGGTAGLLGNLRTLSPLLGATGAFAIGQATPQTRAGHVESILGGAGAGALAGAPFGPEGAAVGAAGGASIALVSNLLHLGSSADKAADAINAQTLAIQGLTPALTSALGLDKGKAGADVKQVFTGFLSQNPDFAHQLRQSGVSLNDLIAYAKGGTESVALQGAFQTANAGGFGGSQGRTSFINNLSTLLQSYSQATGLTSDVGAITGRGGAGTYNRKFPGMPPGRHPPMALPGSAIGGTLKPAIDQAKHDADKGGTETGDTYSTALTKSLRQKLGPHAGEVLRASIGQSVRSAEDIANAGGVNLGVNLAAGLDKGLDIGFKTHVIRAVTHLADGSVRILSTKYELGSPSKLTERYGKWLAQGLAIGFSGYSADLLSTFSTTTQKPLDALGMKLNTAADKYRTDLQARADLKTSIAGSLFGAADIGTAVTSNTGGASLAGFLGSQLATDKRLQTLVDEARRRKLDPRLIEQAVNAGGLQGVSLLTQALVGGAAGIKTLNAQERQLNTITQSIGGAVSGAVFAPTLAGDQKRLDQVAAALEHFVGSRLHLDRADMQQLARDIAHEFAKVFPTLDLKALDKALGLKITGG
jgi:hypothetical protein